MRVPAVLALADGTIFHGQSIGAKGNTTGEVVFNTALTGYQEILTDPSYARQLVTLTVPHVGNTGTTPEDLESAQIYCAGLIIRDLPLLASSWRANETLPQFLERGRLVAIAGIDTRKLTRILREKGAQSGCIMTGEQVDRGRSRQGGAQVPGLKGHGPGQGGLHQEGLPVERGQPVAGERPSADPFQPAPARGGVRLRGQAQHPAPAGRRRLPHDRGAGADLRRGSARARARWGAAGQRSGGSGAVRLRDRRHPETAGHGCAGVRHLPRAPDPRACRRRAHLKNEVRASRRQSPGAGHRDRARVHHQPEPRVRGGREHAAQGREGHAPLARSTARCRAWRSPSVRPSASRDTRRRAPARTTSSRCSSASTT